MNISQNTLDDISPPNLSRRSFMLRASVLATSTALLTLSPAGRALASLAMGPGEMPEAVGRMLLQENCLAFNGERRDPVTGLYHLGQGYRAYNPRMMRFHAVDSLSPFGAGGINPYTYCLGDPINAVDPTGHLSIGAQLGIGLGILGIMISIATLGVGIHAGIALNLAGGALVAGSVLGVASGALGIASSALEESNPELSAALGLASLGSGLASGVAGIAGSAATISKAASITAASATGGAAIVPGSPKAIIAASMQVMRDSMALTAGISGVISGALWVASSEAKDPATSKGLNTAAGYFAYITGIAAVGALKLRFINKPLTRAFRVTPRLDAGHASLGGSRASLSYHSAPVSPMGSGYFTPPGSPVL